MAESQPRVRAPEFPAGLEWLNTGRPLKIAELRGKIIVVDFWTYCCINCMHILPDLKKLEQKYPDELVVIGVHSAKFDGEKQTENIRQAVLRYDIEHPVVNDLNMQVWSQWGVHAWPTVFLLDPEGKVSGYTSGEGIFEPFDRAIQQLIHEFDAKGLIDRKPLHLPLERDKQSRQPLSFPGKVIADPELNRLFIADSSHNRIVVAGLDGNVQEVIGSGKKGLSDGAFEAASFDNPQGMALDGSLLYVADTDNHALRKVDLANRTVETIAGNGKQASIHNQGGPGKEIELNSPWDLVIHQNRLYIAMAGPHQLWQMNLTDGALRPHAGSGREGLVDGPLRSAALAQPSGLATDGAKLFFVDSEVSAVRSADFSSDGRVETVVGLDLFEFGDRDGVGPAVRLQHPLGITWKAPFLLVADTYNNKIKQVDPAMRRCTTLLGSGEEGFQDGDSPRFDEPGGLCVAGDRLFIADTNNHAIRVADLESKSVSTLQLKPVERLKPRE